jgi:hypothetical protein
MGAKAMTDPIKLAIEALENSLDLVEADYKSNWRHGIPTRQAQLAGHLAEVDAHKAALAALRSIKPDCRCCVNFNPFAISGCVFSEKAMCTNFDQFQAMLPVCLTNLTKGTK